DRRPTLSFDSVGGDCALVLLTQATDLIRIAPVAERLACTYGGCQTAHFKLCDFGSDDTGLMVDSHVTVTPAHGRAFLHLSLGAAPARTPALGENAWLDLLDLRLRELLATVDLQRNIASARRSEHLQHALYTIADLAHSDLDLHDMLERVHGIVGELTYA